MSAEGDRHERIMDLRGQWNFMIGDDLQRSAPHFNDSGWESIMVPSSWENQGFPGYDGYAWYRKQVTMSSANRGSAHVLFMGYIDDVDEVFFNGVKIGHKGAFPPYYSTAYNTERQYAIPAELIKYDQSNTIAVRVYDAQLEGGIIRGPVGIYIRHRELPPDIDLEGYWKFKTGDDMAWRLSGHNDEDWQMISVPGYWEDQIQGNYDGFAWYRKQFRAPASAESKRYVLMLGKIDDLDEVYINGQLVGSTGEIHPSPYMIHKGNHYSQDRLYYLDDKTIKPGQLNTIAVRVYDADGGGGIYTGSIGLVELKRFVSHWRRKSR
jgi:sialate O-acetylesterase